MPTLKLKYLLLSTFILIFFTACMHKQTDGKYHTRYSYHPYYDMYKQEMSGTKKNYKKITYQEKNYKKINYRKSIKHKVSYNKIDDAPSNVPIGTYSKDDY